EGGGTHTGGAFGDFLAGTLPANTRRKMSFTRTTILKVQDGKIVSEIGLDDGVAAPFPLELIRSVAPGRPVAWVLDQDADRRLDQGTEGVEQIGADRAVDNAVIARERHRHLAHELESAVARLDGRAANPTDRQDGRMGRVDDGREFLDAAAAEIGHD